MKRFYTTVAVEGSDHVGWHVTLDGRGVRTPQGKAQSVPARGLAEALAAEWDAQGETIEPETLPLRDMVDYALDIVASEPEKVVAKALAYGDTDTLLYRADPDEPLHARQHEVWEPLVTAFEAENGLALTRISGVIHRAQDPQSMARLRAMLDRLDPFVLAGVEAMAGLAASLVVAISALRPDADPVELWQAASLEEIWQAELWGRDPEAEARRARRQAAFLKAREMAVLALGN